MYTITFGNKILILEYNMKYVCSFRKIPPHFVVSIQAFFRDIKALQYNRICIKKIVDPDVYWPWVIQKKKDFTVVRLYTIIQWGDHEMVFIW